MRKLIEKIDIFKRTLFVYMIVCVSAMSLVNGKLFAWQYSQYLSWKYIYGGMRDYKSGVLYYDSITKWNSKDAEAYARLGSCYYYLKEYGNAIEAYRQAVRLRPEFVPYKNDLALIYSLTGKKGKSNE